MKISVRDHTQVEDISASEVKLEIVCRPTEAAAIMRVSTLGMARRGVTASEMATCQEFVEKLGRGINRVAHRTPGSTAMKRATASVATALKFLERQVGGVAPAATRKDDDQVSELATAS